jgi:hypothetical protein
MISRNSLIALLTAGLLLAAEMTIEAQPMTSQTGSTISHLRELLLQDAWVHEVRRGTAIGTYALVFRDKGEMSEQIWDHSGNYEVAGSWKLEESDGKITLVLTGEYLRHKGRFTLQQNAKGDAIDFRLAGGKTALRFERQKGYRPPTDPSMGSRLEDVITEWDWEFGSNVGPRQHTIALESQTLTFCAGGRVRERIGDDTGGGESWGSWSLERSADGYVLRRSGELRYHGSFPVTYYEKEKAFYLHYGPGDILWRFDAVRGQTPSPCTTPKPKRE